MKGGHHTIAVVDVEGYGDHRRTNPHRLTVRDGLYRVLHTAYDAAGIPWNDCHHDDSGDSVLTLVPADVPKAAFVERIPALLVAALTDHNHECRAEERIRLRMALHAGEVTFDERGLSSAAVILACRLLNAAPLKAALSTSPGVLALLVSNWFFDDVVRNAPGAAAPTYRPVRIHEKETTTIGWLALPDHPYPPDITQLAETPPANPRSQVVPRQLPLAVRDFTGRAEHVVALDALIPAAANPSSPAVVISAVDGAAGIGKTTLAVHWAHRVQHRFPDGTLHANLRGYGPGERATPDEVLDGFLRALDVPADRVPADLEARAALFRSVLAGRRVLMVLDNANNANQIRPLLPATPGCMVLVTSRDSLTGLVVTEAAHRLTLDLLSPSEARTLVTGIIGVTRADPDQVEDLIRLCARLPLALRIAAGRIAAHPHLAVADVVAELRDEHNRVEALSRNEDERAAVRAVFDWSYQQLTSEQARLFRRLGLHPGPEMSLYAAAAVAGVDPTEARRSLDKLTAIHLIEPIARDRYRFHDLLRAYAAGQATDYDTVKDRGDAIEALMNWYIQTAYSCIALLLPPYLPVPMEPPAVLNSLPIVDRVEAWEWMRTEHHNLVTVLRYAVTHGLSEHAMQLVVSAGYLLRNFLSDIAEIDIAESGVALVRMCSNHLAEVRLQTELGYAFERLERWDEASAALHEALRIVCDLGNGQWETGILNDIGVLNNGRHRFGDALGYLRKAAPCASGTGRLEALIEGNISWALVGLGEFRAALEHGERGLVLRRECGDIAGESLALRWLAQARQGLGEHRVAIELCRESILLGKEAIASDKSVAGTLETLAVSLSAVGRAEEAVSCWLEAADLYELRYYPQKARAAREHAREISETL